MEGVYNGPIPPIPTTFREGRTMVAITRLHHPSEIVLSLTFLRGCG